MTPYKGKVQCNLYGHPVCYQDGEYCTVKQCKYWAKLFEFGNCILRIDRPHTLDEIGKELGVSKERVRQLIEGVINKSRIILTQG